MKRTVKFIEITAVFVAMCALGCQPVVDLSEEQDTDTNNDWECSDIIWGSGFAVGEIVNNLQFTGYMDDDGDGIVEQQEVEFSLDDIHCTGKKSLVVVWSQWLSTA